MKIKKLDSIPAGDNPFLHDAFHMGTPVASNIMIMHGTHSNQRASYIIIVNTETGERHQVTFDEKKAEKETACAALVQTVSDGNSLLDKWIEKQINDLQKKSSEEFPPREHGGEG